MHRDWHLKDGALPVGSSAMKAGCPHKPGGLSACGGCYARLHLALEMIHENPGYATEICAAVFEAMTADALKAKGAR